MWLKSNTVTLGNLLLSESIGDTIGITGVSDNFYCDFNYRAIWPNLTTSWVGHDPDPHTLSLFSDPINDLNDCAANASGLRLTSEEIINDRLDPLRTCLLMCMFRSGPS